MITEERNVYLEDIPMEDARHQLEMALREAGRFEPLPGETVPLREALGRVTAEPVWARLSSPHYHAAAMDGYAVVAAETLEATETRPVTLQNARPVNTGAPLPPEYNAVIMIENVQENDNGIMINAPVAPWQHIRMMGEDMMATELVLPANHRLRPVDLGAVVGCGYHETSVRRQPHVLVIPTGSELVSADQRPEPGQLIEYNSLVLGAQIEASGGRVTVLPITPDDRDLLMQAVETALSHQPDLILLLSGSSAGTKDFTASIVRERGRLLVHGVAVRPGHPVIMGMVDATPIIGVPGYPVSAALTGEVFIQPLIARWLGVPADITMRRRTQAVITRKLHSPTGDDDFVRVALARVGGQLLATPLSRGAGVITSLIRADGLAHVPRFSEGADKGASVEVLLYRTLHEIEQTILTMGSHDPMIDLLAQHLAARHSGQRLTSANVGSMGGLVALRRDEAHLAGMHLLDEDSGEYNLPYIRRQLKTPVQVVTFAHREQGLIVPKGNPKAVKSLDDLPRLTYINRQRGAGTRLLLDYEMKKRSLTSDDVDGYDREEYTHLAVAAAVATGVADCGLGVRRAASALDMDFISVGWERYDFVIPEVYLELPGIQSLLDVLLSEGFITALNQQPGYDTRQTGQIVS